MCSSLSTQRPVWIGMSGGVDSSLSAALLLESGRDCTGVTLDLGRGDSEAVSIAAAAAVCEHLGIEHRVVDLAAEFREAVVDATAAAYARGLTPNPCVICNVLIKFGMLFDLAASAGADLATGHYVRRVGEGAQSRLAMAADPTKDQSYFMYRLTPDVLAGLTFPLGELTKVEVRALAAARGIDAMHTAESQDACFLGAGGYPALVQSLYPDACARGSVVTADGTVIGTHDGICRFTVGQRKGLGIASTEPLYVTRIDAAANTIMVGPYNDLERRTLTASDAVWSGGEGIVECDVKVRYNSPTVPARVSHVGSGLHIELAVPVFGAAPGQSAVCYRGDTVIGGGFIGEDL
ncbi:MAG: tRNA 2-thiouridine(34) synthase MnmA [Actinomycetota bacterium]|nr:tRNA 2-thiouridine(34) synthase MnmA [Actinomycetota bacterium]